MIRIEPGGLYGQRFQYWPPWRSTFWYRPDFRFGSDEFGNRSLMIGLGPIGTFILFKPFGKMED